MRPCGFAEAYSEHCQASKIDIWHGSEYAFVANSVSKWKDTN